MTKKILDTNVYIDLFTNPELYEDIFVSEGSVYLSSVVLMELLAGAHSKNEKRRVKALQDKGRGKGKGDTDTATGQRRTTA